MSRYRSGNGPNTAALSVLVPGGETHGYWVGIPTIRKENQKVVAMENKETIEW